MSHKDKPWIMRTYAGHSSAAASNELYRANLAKGQTGLSIAFDLPTQIGYDSDHSLAHGEVGKVGVPICSIEDLDRLLEGIPLDRMNTSMTINATAAWLLSLYIALAENRGIAPQTLQGTTQNDIIKEYLSRGTYIFPPDPSMRLITDVVLYTVGNVPKWNPINVCSYHLQEAGATPVQEIAFALCTAIAVLDGTRAALAQRNRQASIHYPPSSPSPARGEGTHEEAPPPSFPSPWTGEGMGGGELPPAGNRQVPSLTPDGVDAIVGRMSFFLNSGIRFVEEMCKVRAFTELWDELARSRYGVEDPQYRRFRYGVQVNSLGLTERQPENNIMRIAFEALGVVLSKSARARSLQLPAWNEALGLPRPWDQQLSLRLQQILAHETDVLEYEDLFDGSPVIRAKVDELTAAAKEEMNRILEMGGIVRAVETGYVKQRLVESNAARLRAIEAGEQTVVGVNKLTETAPSPLTASDENPLILKVDPRAGEEQLARLRAFRSRRNARDVEAALKGLGDTARQGANLMPASIRAAHAGVTTGEWADVLREVFGEYRAPTGVAPSIGTVPSNGSGTARNAPDEAQRAMGRRVRILIGKPGLDGHSNGAEQIAVRARDAGMEVIYAGIRLTPEQIAVSALQEDVDLIGLSILSGSHVELVTEVMSHLNKQGLVDVPVVVGGIIPPPDHDALRKLGVKRIYTPKDFELNAILSDLLTLAAEARRHSS